MLSRRGCFGSRSRFMADSIIFFLYVFAGSMGLVGIIQLLMLAHFDNTGNRELFRSMCLFMVCTAAIDFLYLGYDYYRLRVGHYDSTAILRVLDIELFIFQPVFLCAYMRAKSHLPKEKNHDMEQVSDLLAAVCASAGLIAYGLMMEGYYESVSPVFSKVLVGAELFINLSMTWLLLRHLKVFWDSIIQKETRILVSVIALCCVLNCIVNGILSISILMGHYLSILEYELDMTPLFLLIISTATVLLLYQEDFSTLFRASAMPDTTRAAEHKTVLQGMNSAGTVSAPVVGAAVPAELKDVKPAAENALEKKAETTATMRTVGVQIVEAAGSAEKMPSATLQPETVTGEQGVENSAAIAKAQEETDQEAAKKARLDLIAEEHFLTVREREVLELCYNGMTNPEIAGALYISLNTVKRHLHNIFEKLDVSTRIELVHLVNGRKLD